ncbi:hypothetical protein [Salinibacterium sp. SWN167]|uniref:hypothetical protein n=1 Tax=Salinibacterium sp. SWN167 TaxID=2792054 RepID=UPI0018CFC524|nr:hypothetical protein [Salinibacterium sp. SWN167]MBH0082489.1 hypothetical protein [Salinibacterium sp. SWN167]
MDTLLSTASPHKSRTDNSDVMTKNTYKAIVRLSKEVPARLAKQYAPRRGFVLALTAIPVAILIPTVIALATGVRQMIGIFFAASGMWVALKLFDLGSHRSPLRGRTLVTAIAIGGVAVVLGFGAAVIAHSYASFLAVSGDGGFFGDTFATVLSQRVSEGRAEILVVCAVGIVLAIGIVQLRSQIVNATGRVRALTAEQFSEFTAPGAAPSPAPSPAPEKNATTATSSPALAPTLNESSSGILLNGKPLDEKKPKK